MHTPIHEVELVAERERAQFLLHPLRLRIMEAAREPASAAGLARRLDLKPQKVNYHVRRLSDLGFLRVVEERRAGNVLETVYVASARSYVLASGVLGPLAPVLSDDGVTAGRLLALHARAEAELGAVMAGAGSGGSTLGALALDEEFRFETAQQRAVFTRAVRDLFSAVVRKYTSPAAPVEGPATGRRYRMILGCYPLPDA
jgi:DNA-binding transcriptional ArsR family regulator